MDIRSLSGQSERAFKASTILVYTGTNYKIQLFANHSTFTRSRKCPNDIRISVFSVDLHSTSFWGLMHYA